MKRLLIFGKLILSLFILLTPVKLAFAAHNFQLFDVVLPVVDESSTVRNQAFSRGLKEVFIRMSGDSDIISKLKLPPASSYVKQYSYQPVEALQLDEEGEQLNFLLTVQYNGTHVIEYLRKNGFPVWGEHRSDLVVWMVVRDGRSEYVLKEADSSVIKTAMERNFERRGVPVHWPAYNSTDRKILTFADIRGGFREPLEKASSRYARGPVLSVSLSWNGRTWRSNWTLLFKNTEYRWSHKGRDFERVIQQASDQIADKMGQLYAVKELSADEETPSILVHVSDISTIAQYRRVSDYLGLMPAVKMLRLIRVDSMSCEFELQLRSSREDFLVLLKNDAELIEAEKPKSESIPAEKQDDPVSANPQGLQSDNAQKEKPVDVGMEKLSESALETPDWSDGTPGSEYPVVPDQVKKVYYFRLAK